jgi:thiamine biosynthesis protein ThiI
VVEGGHRHLSLSEHIFDVVIVRFGGEIGIKGDWTRKLFERRLVSNIKATLKYHVIPYTFISRKLGRIYIKTLQPEKTAETLSKVFGISSLSPALETTSNMQDISNATINIAKVKFKKRESFAVTCRRVGKHPYTSQDIGRQVGKSLLTSLPDLKLQVDLTHPEQTLQVEVREDKAYVSTDAIKGAGGLPLGTQPKVVCLLKGDVPSAVACWMTMKRGCPAVWINFQSSEFAPESTADRVKSACKELMNWSIGFPRILRVVKYDEDFQNLCQKHSTELVNLLWKRFMLRTCQRIAVTAKAEGIVTGDSLEQGADQTLHAFRIEDEAVSKYPVYRPLFGLDAVEIDEIAERIGFGRMTFQNIMSNVETKEASKVKVELEDVRMVEKKLNVERMVDYALESLQVLKL